MNLLLDLAVPGDAPAIADILSDWIDQTPWMPRIHTRQEDRAFGQFLIDRTKVTVARQGARVLGFLALQGEEVQALYLDAAARRQGTGALLLRNAQQQSARLGLWTFQANSGARRFYARNGFIEIKQTDGAGNDEGLPDVRLNWTRQAQ